MRKRETRKVWNDSDTEYVEKWKDREIRIPARGHIIMTRKDCVAFMGYFTGYDKEYPERSVKALRWTPHETEDIILEGHPCHICGLRFNTPQELSDHTKEHAGQPAAKDPGDINHDSEPSLIADSQPN